MTMKMYADHILGMHNYAGVTWGARLNSQHDLSAHDRNGAVEDSYAFFVALLYI